MLPLAALHALLLMSVLEPALWMWDSCSTRCDGHTRRHSALCSPHAPCERRVICAKEDGDKGGFDGSIYRKDRWHQVLRPGYVVAAVAPQEYVRLLARHAVTRKSGTRAALRTRHHPSSPCAGIDWQGVPPTHLHACVVDFTLEDGVCVVLSTNLVLCLQHPKIAGVPSSKLCCVRLSPNRTNCGRCIAGATGPVSRQLCRHKICKTVANITGNAKFTRWLRPALLSMQQRWAVRRQGVR